MGSEFAEIALEKIINWAESLPSGMVGISISENPTANSSNRDYFVDYEITITPNNNSLGITIWISNDAIGFFIGNFSDAAKILNARVGGIDASLACIGSEPVTYISTESILEICMDLSSSKLPIHGLIMNGKLKGTYSKIRLRDDSELRLSNRTPYILAKAYTYFRIAEIKKIPYKKW